MTAFTRAQQAGNLYETEPMTIGNHEWRLVVFQHFRYGPCTTYQWRPLGSDEWRNDRDWPAYNADKWYNAARVRWDVDVARYGEKPPAGVRARMGLDVAEMGDDSNVACLRYGGWVAPMITWSGVDVLVTGETKRRSKRCSKGEKHE